MKLSTIKTAIICRRLSWLVHATDEDNIHLFLSKYERQITENLKWTKSELCGSMREFSTHHVETLKRTLTREDKMIGIESFDETEKLAESRCS